MAGTIAAARYMMDTGLDAIRSHEEALLPRLVGGLRATPAVKLHGAPLDRTPTVMFSVAGHTPGEVAAALAAERIAVWHGNYYAYELERFLGLEPDGAVRAGIVHYNDQSDVERLLEGVARLC